MIDEDEHLEISDAYVIDFKTLEGGEDTLINEDLEWTELALQVQLYAKAARDALGHLALHGFAHPLKDSQRLEIPITDAAVTAALANVEWAVYRIVASDFPMLRELTRGTKCDFNKTWSMRPQQFPDDEPHPRINVPNESELWVFGEMCG